MAFVSAWSTLAFFLALLLGLVFVLVELNLRKSKNLQPSSLRGVWTYAQKKTSPSPQYSALLFALIAIYIFQFWEAFLRFLLQRELSIALSFLGLFLLLGLLYWRLREFKTKNDFRLGFDWLLICVAGFSLLLNSWGTLLFLPWVAFRARFLPNKILGK